MHPLCAFVCFRELSKFIASGRLHCRIDKVGGVVETNRPDSKNFLYQVKHIKKKKKKKKKYIYIYIHIYIYIYSYVDFFSFMLY